MKLLCRFLGHSVYPIDRLSDQATRVVCSRCGQHFAINHHLGVALEWDDDLEQFYRDTTGVFYA